VTSERVTSITLPANNLTGELPTDVYTLSELINLILNDNALSGTLSTQVGNLTKLKILNLGGNAMTGTVPTEIYSLTGLIEPLSQSQPVHRINISTDRWPGKP
jgi:Leucine-rich repeat (LRR) protein